MSPPQDVTGTPNWDLAREAIAQLQAMPAATAEANVRGQLRLILGFLFPGLPQSELTLEKAAGDGRIDVYCRNVVFETKGQGKLDARRKPDGTTETPEKQAVRYLDALTAMPNMFASAGIGWRAGVTDGKEWFFYDYDREAPDGAKLTPVNTLRLDTPEDGETLLSCLYDFVNRSVKMAPPTDDTRWAESLAQPFIDLAARYEDSPEYDVKRSLWRGVLRGAFLNPQGDAAAERALFARHTMLVLTARAVAETLRPAGPEPQNAAAVRDRLAEGFAAWLLDAAGADGIAAIDALIAAVNKYAWSAANRDTLKDLYHAVIPRQIRHDFGEYYTPDWLARAVCEEVMDAGWRQETIAMAVAGQLAGPAVLDPSCGSGTFLYHATQLLLEDARRHPELANSPQAQVEMVNNLVAGIDLHPVAVELSKTTKMLAFAENAAYAFSANAESSVHLGDSLQWETRRNRTFIAFDEMVEIPGDAPDNPLRLPSSLLVQERFPQLLRHLFSYANRPENRDTEANLLAVLNLPNPADREAIIAVYRRLREYIASGRNNVWQWYIANLVQPLRLANMPVSRLVGNPPWVVYNAMDNFCPRCGGNNLDCRHLPGRQDAFRQHAADRALWAGAHLATQNDLAATFVATCVDYYLQTGGKFGFVLPYAALRARQWAPFRTGDWSLRQDTEQGTHVDLSKDAWDFSGVNAPPFPQAQSSVLFGTRVPANRQNPNLKPLAGVQQKIGTDINTKMAWDEVKPLLSFTYRKRYPTAPSAAYADEFRQGTTLVPQPLVLFDEANAERALGLVRFHTEQGKGDWRGIDRNGRIEERFAKPALFSKHIVPFGVTGHLNAIAPYADDDSVVLRELPQGSGVRDFNLYWSEANADYIQIKKPKSPATLAMRVDHNRGLSARLQRIEMPAVVYTQAGSWLASAVIPSGTVIDSTLYWYATATDDELHYLAALFNAQVLADFFHIAGRASDRHFHTGPIRNLPIPAYDAGNRHHANLAAQSQRAHRRVAALVAERQASRRRVNRNDVLRDGAMQPILASIDESARAILPAYCA